MQMGTSHLMQRDLNIVLDSLQQNHSQIQSEPFFDVEVLGRVDTTVKQDSTDVVRVVKGVGWGRRERANPLMA